MKDMHKRQFLLGSLLFCGTGLTLLAPPPRPARRDVQAILDRDLPDRVDGWSAADIPGFVIPERDAQDKSAYDGHVMRAYVRDGQAPIFLVVAYGSYQDYTLQIHRPEACYPASGYALTARRDLAIPVGKHRIAGSSLTAIRGSRSETVLFWTRIGQSFPKSQWEARRDILFATLKRQVPDGALVRISIPEDRGDASAATLLAFTQALYRSTGTAAKSLIFGMTS